MRLRAHFVGSVLLASCADSDTTGPAHSARRTPTFSTGRVEVFVHWQEMGIEGKRVEVLELSREKLTSEDGIATFRVPVGTYTVRVYDVNRGGPALRYVDTKVSVTAGDKTRVEVVDCLLCV
jgi:hypothetical protein